MGETKKGETDDRAAFDLKYVLASLPMALQEEKGKLIFQHPDHFQVHHIISNSSAVGKASQVTWTLN